MNWHQEPRESARRKGILVFLIEKFGLVRELNPGPRAPEARIIPLDQRAIDRPILCLFSSVVEHQSRKLGAVGSNPTGGNFCWCIKICRSWQGSNLRGQSPLDFKSNALTTRPQLLSYEMGLVALVLAWVTICEC